MQRLSVTETIRIVSEQVEVPRLLEEAPEGPWQDYFTAQLGLRMAGIIETHAENGYVVEENLEHIIQEVQEMFEREKQRATKGGVEFGK